MKIAVLGAGAFGTSLAIALASRHDVTLWARSKSRAIAMQQNRSCEKLPGFELPKRLAVQSDPIETIKDAAYVLTAVPMQVTHEMVRGIASDLDEQVIIGCSKGIDKKSGLGCYSTLKASCPNNAVGLLTGPSFAHDVAAGKPTALTLAADPSQPVQDWQADLSTQSLRLYASDNPYAAEFGGALKNVIAIACGIAIGAGLGESARAALIARGYAEMVRWAEHNKVAAEPLAGLAGLGDLALTCTSERSRNFAFGQQLAMGGKIDEAITVEGKATALALEAHSKIDLPITKAVAQICRNEITIEDALNQLMSRPLKEEF